MKKLPKLHGTYFFCQSEWLETLSKLSVTEDSPWPKITPGTRVSRSKRVNCYRIEGNNTEAYYKTYHYYDRIFEFLFRPSKCLTEVYTYEVMKKVGIPCPEVLACGERRIFGRLYENFIITEGIENSQDLDQYALVWKDLPKYEKKTIYKKISSIVLTQLKQAHKNNFFHYDLNWRNIMVRNQDGEWQAFWIDSPRGRIKNFNRQKGVIVDLSALARLAIFHLRKAQQYKFICDYLGVKGGKEAKQLYKQIALRLEKRPPKAPKVRKA